MAYKAVPFEEYPSLVDLSTDRTVERIVEIRGNDIPKLQALTKEVASISNVINNGTTTIKLQSPDGTIWLLSIDNAGVLITTPA